jgi:hypothetical protein
MRQGLTWYAVVEVPAALQSKLGMRRVKRTLATTDIHIARVRRLRVVAQIKESFLTAGREVKGDPLTVEALEWRATLKEFGEADDNGDGMLREQLSDRAHTLEETKGHHVAKAFHDLATGRTTPLALYVEAWLADGGVSGGALEEKTLGERRRAVEKLQAWLQEVQITATVEAVTTKVAGRYMSEVLLPSGRQVKTIIKAVSALSGYWQWLIRRGHLVEGSADPWRGQAPRKRKTDANGRDAERAFTDAEVVRLLSSAPGPTSRTSSVSLPCPE